MIFDLKIEQSILTCSNRKLCYGLLSHDDHESHRLNTEVKSSPASFCFVWNVSHYIWLFKLGHSTSCHIFNYFSNIGNSEPRPRMLPTNTMLFSNYSLFIKIIISFILNLEYYHDIHKRSKNQSQDISHWKSDKIQTVVGIGIPNKNLCSSFLGWWKNNWTFIIATLFQIFI